MAAAKYNFTIEQGATFTRPFTWKDANDTLVPLPGTMQARMQLRIKTADPDPPVLEMTTENGGIELVDPGVIIWHINSVVTAALDFKTAEYDMEIVDPTTTPETVQRLLFGQATLSREVTR